MTLLDKALEGYTRHLSPDAKRLYGAVVRDYQAFAGPNPQNWTQESAQAFYDQLTKRVSIKSANLMIGVLRSVSRHLAATTRDDSFRFVEAIRKARYKRTIPKVKAFSAEEARRLLRACAGDGPGDLRDRAIVILGLLTGMRRMSIAGINREDFGEDFVDITIKGSGRHRVPLSQNVMRWVAPWANWLNENGAFFRRLSKPRLDDSVTVGGRLSREGVHYAIAERARAAGLNNFHPHVFRYTFVTLAKLQGAPNHVIASVTGHSLPGMSAMLDQVYTDATRLAADAQRMQDQILVVIT